MEQGFWRLYWASFKRSYGALIAVMGLPVAFVLWAVVPKSTIGVEYIIAAVIVLLPIVMSLVHMAYVLSGREARALPKVLQSRQILVPQREPMTILLLEESELFAQGVAVSLYYTDENGFEVLTGFGSVINIQDDKRIQVNVERHMPGQDDVVERMSQNEKNVLGRLRVKPTIPAVDIISGFGG